MGPILLAYLLKLSLSLAVVFCFYRLVLQNLTFYSWNRWYLLAFTAMSFVIPLVDISTWWVGHPAAALPAVTHYMPQAEAFGKESLGKTEMAWSAFWAWEALLLALLAGIGGLLLRTGVQVLSFLRIRRKAQLVSDQEVRIYQVDADILPFSFGRAVFLNRHLHREQDLPEIIRHELVHVQQGHTADLLWMELVCILNWYNPFAWLLRRQVRENLEFIADRQVLQAGIDKKHYQYLLLQVTGGPAFHLSNQFNFSPLKKRIMMMNKMPSTRPHLARFLFLLPLVSVLLLAFRGAEAPTAGQGREEAGQTHLSMPAREDATPGPGMSAATNGKLAPGLFQEETKAKTKTQGKEVAASREGEPDPYNVFMKRNPQVRGLQWINEKQVIIQLKSGEREIYDLKNKESLAAVEMKYGKLPPLPPPPPAPPVPEPAPPAPPAAPVEGKVPPAERELPAPPPVPSLPAKPLPPSLGNKVGGMTINYYTYLA